MNNVIVSIASTKEGNNFTEFFIATNSEIYLATEWNPPTLYYAGKLMCIYFCTSRLLICLGPLNVTVAIALSNFNDSVRGLVVIDASSLCYISSIPSINFQFSLSFIPTSLATSSTSEIYISSAHEIYIFDLVMHSMFLIFASPCKWQCLLLFSNMLILTCNLQRVVSSGIPVDGSLNVANVVSITSLAIDDAMNIYLVDSEKLIRRIANGSITTMAGRMSNGYVDGSGSAAIFGSIAGMVVSFDIFGSSNVYISDEVNSAIRVVSCAAGNTCSRYCV